MSKTKETTMGDVSQAAPAVGSKVVTREDVAKVTMIN